MGDDPLRVVARVLVRLHNSDASALLLYRRQPTSAHQPVLADGCMLQPKAVRLVMVLHYVASQQHTSSSDALRSSSLVLPANMGPTMSCIPGRKAPGCAAGSWIVRPLLLANL